MVSCVYIDEQTKKLALAMLMLHLFKEQDFIAKRERQEFSV